MTVIAFPKPKEPHLDDYIRRGKTVDDWRTDWIAYDKRYPVRLDVAAINACLADIHAGEV